jgi:myo-inositol-1(or 4)-monophosphatase
MSDDERMRFRKVERAAHLSRYGGDCYAYCMVAAGYADVVVEAGLQPYDVLPLIPIVEGAGGIVTTWDGGSPLKGGRIIVAGDRRVHEEAVRLLGDRA